jgi:hypothetical protein
MRVSALARSRATGHKSGASRRHPHAGGTCRQAQSARLLGLREDPRARPKSDSMSASLALRAVQLGGRGDMAGCPRAPRRHSDKTVSSEPPERAAPGPAKTGLILKKARRTFPRIWADRVARRTGAPVANTSARPTPKWPSLARSLNWSPLSNSRQLATWTAHLMPFLCCHGSVQPTVPQRDLLQ